MQVQWCRTLIGVTKFVLEALNFPSPVGFLSKTAIGKLIYKLVHFTPDHSFKEITPLFAHIKLSSIFGFVENYFECNTSVLEEQHYCI